MPMDHQELPATGKTILLIEDDEPLREMVVTLLERHGYRVLSAGDADEAMQAVEREKGKIDVLLADILLPGLSGPEIARELKNQNPNLKVIFASGSHSENVLHTIGLVNMPIFITKPYDPETVLGAIRIALA